MVEPHHKDPKEIRLFGEKSLREEAYRQKILQLEQDMARLEARAKTFHADRPKMESPSADLEGRYQESLAVFDKRIRREQELLERRASDVTQRLDLQAQRLIIELDSSFRKKIIWLLLFVSVLFAASAFMFLVLYSANRPSSNSIGVYGSKVSFSRNDKFDRRLSYTKRALQTHTIYRNQYEVIYLDILNGIYVAEIELNLPHTDKWFLKKLSSDLIDVFQRYISDAPAEFSILYHGKLLIKAYLTHNPTRVRFQFFQDFPG